jgi:hypothetical protein
LAWWREPSRQLAHLGSSWAAVESVKRVGPHTRVGALRDRVADRQGGNIGAVAAARQQIEYVFYALRDRHVRALQHPDRESA